MIKRWIVSGVAVLFVGGCASSGSTTTSNDSDTSASAYNTQLGIAYLRQGNLPLAKEKLERALKQNPRDADTHTGLALLHDRLDDTKRADDFFRSALRLAPRNPDISNNYAAYLCKRGRYDEGVARFEEVASNRLYRSPEAAYTNAGVCYRTAKRLPEAERSFQRALQIRPNYAEAALQITDLYLERSQVTEARAQIETYLNAFRPTPDLLLIGVRTMRAAGDRLAEERYARRLRLDFPDSQQARALAELQRSKP
jgi:type IV pilus assembly protein PilF